MRIGALLLASLANAKCKNSRPKTCDECPPSDPTDQCFNNHSRHCKEVLMCDGDGDGDAMCPTLVEDEMTCRDCKKLPQHCVDQYADVCEGRCFCFDKLPTTCDECVGASECLELNKEWIKECKKLDCDGDNDAVCEIDPPKEPTCEECLAIGPACIKDFKLAKHCVENGYHSGRKKCCPLTSDLNTCQDCKRAGPGCITEFKLLKHCKALGYSNKEQWGTCVAPTDPPTNCVRPDPLTCSMCEEMFQTNRVCFDHLELKRACKASGWKPTEGSNDDVCKDATPIPECPTVDTCADCKMLDDDCLKLNKRKCKALGLKIKDNEKRCKCMKGNGRHMCRLQNA